MGPQDKPKKKRYRAVIESALALMCIGYIVYFFWSRRGTLQVAFNFKPQTVILVMTMQFVYFVMHSYRYRIILEKCSGIKVPFRPWFKVFILGRFLNKFAPQMGNVYRSVRLKGDFGISYTEYVTGFFSFAWMDTLFNLLIALAVLLISGGSSGLGTGKIQQVVVVSIILVAAAPVVLNTLSQLIHFRAKSLSWLHSKLSEVLATTISNLSDWRYMLRFILIGAVVFAHMSALLYVCFIGLGMPVNVSAVALFYALYKLSTYVNITPGNLGIREIAYGVLSESLNIGMAQGIVVSVTLRVLGYIVLVALSLPFGGIDLLRHSEWYRTRSGEE